MHACRIGRVTKGHESGNYGGVNINGTAGQVSEIGSERRISERRSWLLRRRKGSTQFGDKEEPGEVV